MRFRPNNLLVTGGAGFIGANFVRRWLEDDRTGRLVVYDALTYGGNLVHAYHHTYGLSTTTTNCSNNYGPYQFPEKLIPLMIVHILLGRPLPVYGDGRQVRDWLHVSDHCAAIELALAHGVSGAVYNIGGDAEMANIDLVHALCGRLDAALDASPELRALFPHSPRARGGRSAQLVEHVTDRLGHDRRYAIDHSKATAELGYAPSCDFAAGLNATVDWYTGHIDWWERHSGVGLI